MGHTVEERYLLKLFEKAEQGGDPTQEIDRYALGKDLGFNPRRVDTVVRLLTQSNFIKKGEGDAIYLIGGGLALIAHLKRD